MKKLLLSILTCICTCCCLLFTGCSTDGTYKLVKMRYINGDTEVSLEVGDKFEGVKLTEDSFIMIVDGNQAIFRTHTEYEAEDGEMETETDVMIGTLVEGYEDEIYFTNEEGETLVVKKDGKTLTIEFSRTVVLILKK